VRWNLSDDMPWPKDEPALPNPPEGTPINFYLKSAATGPVTLEILTTAGALVRRYSSADTLAPVPAPENATVPVHWYRPPQPLPTGAGLHRFYWDLRYQPLAGGGGRGGGPSIQAIPYNSAPAATTPLVVPGTYTVKLTVNGASYTQPIVVKGDPRVKTPALALQQLYSLISGTYFGTLDSRAAQDRARSLREQIAERMPQATGAAKSALEAFDKKVESIAGAQPAAAPGGGRGGGRGGAAPAAAPPDTLAGAAGALGGLVNSLGAADVQPTANQVNAITTAQAAATRVMARWKSLLSVDLPALNVTLSAAKLSPIK